jgi:hypothetical protein
MPNPAHKLALEIEPLRDHDGVAPVERLDEGRQVAGSAWTWFLLQLSRPAGDVRAGG